MKPKSATSDKECAAAIVLLTLSMCINSQSSIAAPVVSRPSSVHRINTAAYLPPNRLVSFPDPRYLKLSPEYLEQYKREPNNELAFWKAGNYLLSAAKVDELRNLCKQASISHPQWATPYFMLAKLADSALDDLESAANFKRAFELSPNWPAAALAAVQKLILCDKPREAIPIADAGLKICYENVYYSSEFLGQLSRSKAEALYNLKEYAAAAQVLEKIQKHNRLEPMEKQLATCYKASKQWAKCLALADNYLKEHPTNEDFRLLRAQAYSATGQWQKAVDDLTINLNLHRAMKHRIFSATEIFRKQEVLLLRAQMYEKLGRKDLAKKDRNELNRQRSDSYQDAPFINRH